MDKQCINCACQNTTISVLEKLDTQDVVSKLAANTLYLTGDSGQDAALGRKPHERNHTGQEHRCHG